MVVLQVLHVPSHAGAAHRARINVPLETTTAGLLSRAIFSAAEVLAGHPDSPPERGARPRLFFRGVRLKENDRLLDYGIRSHSTIQMYIVHASRRGPAPVRRYQQSSAAKPNLPTAKQPNHIVV